MVVEDESVVALSLRKKLESLGYEVPAVCGSGEEALAKVTTVQPDAILMDIMLAGQLDGVATAQRILDRYRVPIIYLTAYSDERTLQRAKHTAPFGYLIKPFEGRELRSTLEMALYRHQMEKQLEDQKRWLTATLRSIGDGVIAATPQRAVAFMNPAAEAVTGWTEAAAIGQALGTVVALCDEQSRAPVDCLTAPAEAAPAEWLLVTRDGGEKPVEYKAAPIADERGVPLGVVLSLRDVSERRQTQKALFEAKERAQVTLHSIGDAVITTDARGIVDYLNPVAEALTRWTTAEAQGRPLAEVFQIVDEQHRQPLADPVTTCLQAGKTAGLTADAILISRAGQEYHIDDSAAPIRDRDGQVRGAVLVFHDVTEQRRLARKLEHDATHDALTGLINRAEFERRVERALSSTRQYGFRHALCFLDLDQFKIVNDTAGHAAGDELLRQINTLLAGMFRERDTLARIGGDEFGLLLDNCPLERAQVIAQTVVANIRDYRFDWKGRIYQIGGSIGLVPITAEVRDTTQLLSQADVACYIAKEKGRNRVHVYQSDDTETKQRHGEILGATGLRDALEKGRFRLHYQPIVPLHTSDQRGVYYEVLLRVASKLSPAEHSELVMPTAFIPAAERYGLMSAIDRWVIQEAFRAYALGVGKTGACIAINLSGNSLNEESLLAFIEAQFAKHAVPPERVCFEIAETAAIHNLRRAGDLMAALKPRGCRLALDDFGSGLSSFHYLKNLPVDYLKIDGGFVKDLAESASDRALVMAINQMSHTLGVQTVAEHVENEAIVGHLRDLGVDYAQGYFFGRPSPWSGVS
jgi:diguanylate cyclase (GGDEF)-like protein/PAS domain S-box-containing protein